MVFFRALTGYSQYTDTALYTRANLILSKLKNNQAFQQMFPSYHELEIVVMAFNMAYINAEDKSTLNISIKNTKRKELISFLSRLSYSINAIANGDKDLLLTTGYEITSDQPKDKQLGTIDSFTAVNLKTKGQVLSECNAVKNVNNYIHQYVKGVDTKDSIWTSIPLSVRKYTHTGLDSGEKYSFRIIAIGKGGEQTTSRHESIFIQ